LTGEATYRDPLPKPNRFNLPQRLPLPAACVAGTMAALTLIALYLTLTLLTVFIPTTIVGFVTVAYLGLQTWAFLQRDSYRGTRITLVVAPVILFLFAPWFLPIALIALYFAFNSDDVHRWSPLGQGNKPREVVQRRERKIWLHVLPLLTLVPLFFLAPELVWLSVYLWIFARHRTRYETHRRGRTVTHVLILLTLVNLVSPILLTPVLIILAIISERRQRMPKGSSETDTGIAYKVYAAHQDANIVADINNAMAYAGHRFIWRDQKSQQVDYHIVVISNYSTATPSIDELEQQGGKIVVVLASRLSSSQRYADYYRYQWVDYRQQDPERLVAMARDMKGGQGINSFSTRIIPRDFLRMVLPQRVFLFAIIQLIFLNVTIARLARIFALGDEFNTLALISIAGSLVVSMVVIQRILERRITIEAMVRINLATAFAINLAALVVRLTQPTPPGVQRDDRLGLFVVVNIVSLFLFYFIGRYQIGTIMKWWLPSFYARGTGLGGKNTWLLRTVAISGIVVALLTLSFFGPDIPVSHAIIPPQQVQYERVDIEGGLSLSVPDHWLIIPRGVGAEDITPYIRNTPFSMLLLEASGPLNEGLAYAINGYFQSPLAGNTLEIAMLISLGEVVSDVYGNIIFFLSPGSAPWRPDYFGVPVYTTAYVPDGDTEDALTVIVYAYYDDTPFSSSVSGVATRARNAPNTQQSDLSIASPVLSGVEIDSAFFALEDELRVKKALFTYDTHGRDYFMVISGPNRALREFDTMLEEIIASVDFG